MNKTSSLYPRPAASLEGTVRSYGAIRALDGFDLLVCPGEIVALLGPNGAGKTTAISLLLGLARPERGRVEVLGGDPTQLAVRRRLGAMLQIGAVPENLTVREHLELAAAWYGDPTPLAEVIAAAGLEGLERRRAGRLSGGQQRRLLFGLALAGAPELLLLDEPTVALDVEARRSLWQRVRALAGRGVAVLLTTHDLAEAAELATRVVVIHQGRAVADGTPAEISRRTGLKRIRCRSALDAGVLLGWPGIAHSRRAEGRLELEASDPDGVLRRLFAADPGLADLEVVGSSLEEALLTLTQKAA